PHPLGHERTTTTSWLCRSHLLGEAQESMLAVAQLTERVRGHTSRSDLGDERFELRSHQKRLTQIVVGKRAHAHAAVRLERDETERGEPSQRLAYRRPRDTEALRQLFLPQHRAGHQL